MYYIQDPFAHIPLVWKWSALLAELACFTYARNLFLAECRESDYDSFQLHVLEFLEIDVADFLVPQIQVSFDFEAFCKHGELYLIWFQDKHSAFSLTVSYQSPFSLNKAPFIIELYLHDLFDNLAYQV